jgi:hypothetical protein
MRTDEQALAQDLLDLGDEVARAVDPCDRVTDAGEEPLIERRDRDRIAGR